MSQKIQTAKIKDLIPYAGNSRQHSDQQVRQLSASIKEFGFNNPILVDENNGIIAGHGRLLAAEKLGLKEVPTIMLSHLSDAQRRAYVIADNKLALNADWDAEVLEAEIERLREENFDLDLLGFDEEDLGSFEVEESDLPVLDDSDREPIRKMTFTVHDEQHEEIEEALKKAKSTGAGTSELNENSNGNALAWICTQYNRYGKS